LFFRCGLWNGFVSHQNNRLRQGIFGGLQLGYDQPGTGARIAHHGTGEFIEVDELTTARPRGLIEKVLQDPSYRERADYFQKVISRREDWMWPPISWNRLSTISDGGCRVTTVLLHEENVKRQRRCKKHD
jgi:hypothetical protein